MGRFRAIFDSVVYSAAIMLLLFAGALFLGITPQFGVLFSPLGFVVLAFLVYTLIAK
ncbi:MAG: hypothetical protein NTW59_00945 [Candidatus Diapherotrites archaeon]|nr:hypothetical protein [Candidatus Diapherotrites archaeon]